MQGNCGWRLKETNKEKPKLEYGSCKSKSDALCGSLHCYNVRFETLQSYYLHGLIKHFKYSVYKNVCLGQRRLNGECLKHKIKTFKVALTQKRKFSRFISVSIIK